MKIHRIACLFLFFGFYFSIVSAQQFGGNPAHLKWRQIDTDTTRIIFPEGLDTTANRVAEVIHQLQRAHYASIGPTLRKVNVVLQNQTTVSNAYVGLAPYRSEFYLFAPQNNFELGTLAWADNLSLHEYRHVQQYSNYRVGWSKVLSIILGQEGQAVANAAAVPDWFFEGDAVFTETALSSNGRGRLPHFFKDYQSLFYGSKKYSYMKLRNGSLRHFVPNHYALGYLLVAYGREKYGPEIWRKITVDAAAFKPLIYPLQGALKKHTGITYNQFVKDAFQFYTSQWQQQKVPELQWLTAAPAAYVTHYRYPYRDENGGIVALKSGYRQIPVFVRIDSSGRETKLAVRDIANDDYFSYNSGKLVYAGLKPDARWSYRQYSNITVLDAATGKGNTVSRGHRYFSPDISHSGNRIAAVEMTTGQQSNLVVMDMAGKVMLEKMGGSGMVFTYPKFSANDQYLYTAVRDGSGGMALQKIKVDDGSAETVTVLPFGNRVIGLPAVQGDTVLFSSSYQGSDEVWAYLEKENSIYRVATYPTGLYGAVLSNGLVVSAFTANGYRLARIPAGQQLWQKVVWEEAALPDLYVNKALQQENSGMLQQVLQQSFAVKKYHKFTHPFNFHSWRPYFDEPEFSLTLYGQNILNTLQTELAYTYNRNEGSHAASGNIIYGGWYVQPYAGIRQTWSRTIRLNADTTLHYKELDANFGLQLPLNFTGGRQYRFITPSISISNKQVQGTCLGKNFIRSDNFNYLQARLVYSGQIQRATQHIYPRWAQTFVLQYRNIINNRKAHQWLATGTIYLPGLHTNHNLVVTGAYHARDTLGQYIFSNSFPFSRGYSAIDFPRMWRLGVNYHLPLVYPDWGFGNMVYFRRIRANPFYDYTRGKSLRTGMVYPFSTAGIELYFDTRWWNQQEVTFGIRYSRLLDRQFRGVTQPNQWQIIMPVNLFSYR